MQQSGMEARGSSTLPRLHDAHCRMLFQWQGDHEMEILGLKVGGTLQFIFTRISYASDSRKQAQLNAVLMEWMFTMSVAVELSFHDHCTISPPLVHISLMLCDVHNPSS